MKLPICLLAALTLSAGAYAQTSQTFHFGEGQSSVSSTPARPHAESKQKSQHRKRHRGQVTQPDTYSHN